MAEAKLKPIFDDAQWRLLSLQFDRARSLENLLTTNGFVPDGVPTVVAPAAATNK